MLFILTAISGLFLLSVLGVSGEASTFVDVIGAAELGCAFLGAIIEMSSVRDMVKVSVIEVRP